MSKFLYIYNEIKNSFMKQLFLCLALLALAGLFIFENAEAISSNLVISQVQTGAPGKSHHDFIKLYNAGETPFDLDGHRLVKRTKNGTTDTTIKSFTSTALISPRSYYTWANSEEGFSASLNADCATTQTIADDNAIAIRQGPADLGTLIDSVAWGEAANGLAEGANFPNNPAPGQILTRINNSDSDNNATDFALVDNSPDSAPEVPPVVSAGVVQNFHDGLVVINELVSDPSDGAKEWIELYNTSASPVDINDWTLEYVSGSRTILSGSIDKFFVIDSPKGSLNNTGDLVILKDEFGVVVDQLVYGEWPGTANNAPVAKAPNSLARKVNGQRSGGYQNDWTVSASPSQGASNIISDTIETDNVSVRPSATKDDCPIIFTEIYPNPLGPDEAPLSGPGEFIEIYNNSSREINLATWRLVLESQPAFVLELQVIRPGEYLSLPSKLTHLKLPNQGATLKLFESKTEKPCSQIKYPEASSPSSWSLDSDTLSWSKPVWDWSFSPSPGLTNIIKPGNRAPSAVLNYETPRPDRGVQFDASDSFDPDGNTLTYDWDFGDNTKSDRPYPDHLYSRGGGY